MRKLKDEGDPRMGTVQLDASAYTDDFARRGLPAPELWPTIDQSALDALGYPRRVNAAVEILDKAVSEGFGARPCLRSAQATWTYEMLLERSDRVAAVLVHDLGLAPGKGSCCGLLTTRCLPPAGLES